MAVRLTGRHVATSVRGHKVPRIVARITDKVVHLGRLWMCRWKVRINRQLTELTNPTVATENLNPQRLFAPRAAATFAVSQPRTGHDRRRTPFPITTGTPVHTWGV
jgi:hypothetical protein